MKKYKQVHATYHQYNDKSKLSNNLSEWFTYVYGNEVLFLARDKTRESETALSKIYSDENRDLYRSVLFYEE